MKKYQSIILISLILFFISITPALAQLACPPGTVYKKLANPKKDVTGYEGLYWGGESRFEGQIEEYCHINGIKHGPYLKFGPNGETEESGNFNQGQKDGVWKIEIPSAIQLMTYDNGKIVDNKVSTPTTYVVDFEACIPHGKLIYLTFGSDAYKIKGPVGENCIMEFSGEIEMGAKDVVKCKVPKSMKKVTFSTTGTAIGLRDIVKEYCQ